MSKRRERKPDEWYAAIESMIRERHRLPEDWRLTRTAWVGRTGKHGMDVTLKSQFGNGSITVRLTQAECDAGWWEDESC